MCQHSLFCEIRLRKLFYLDKIAVSFEMFIKDIEFCHFWAWITLTGTMVIKQYTVQLTAKLLMSVKIHYFTSTSAILTLTTNRSASCKESKYCY